jgi:hypothetical protein
MNIELKPRIQLFSGPVAAPANEDAELRSQSGSPRRRVVIYRPAKSAMTSGRAGTKHWLLEFEPQAAPFIEPLMGWTGSTDPLAQVRLTFPTREAAVAYAKRQGLDYQVREAVKPVKTRRSVDQPPSQPMTLWPVESLHSDRNCLLFPAIGAAGPAPGLAA